MTEIKRNSAHTLTSPLPAFNTALIKDMMAVFRFTSSRYLPMLRSSSLSRVCKAREVVIARQGSNLFIYNLINLQKLWVLQQWRLLRRDWTLFV